MKVIIWGERNCAVLIAAADELSLLAAFVLSSLCCALFDLQISPNLIGFFFFFRLEDACSFPSLVMLNKCFVLAMQMF